MTAPDILQLNMDTISKELSDLVVAGEEEFSVTQKCLMVHENTAAHAMITRPVLGNNFQVPTYIANSFYNQQQFYGNSHVLQNANYHLNYYPALEAAVPPVAVINNSLNSNNNFRSMPNALNMNNCSVAANYATHTRLASTQNYAKVTDAPAFEFHYLRSHGGNENKLSSCGQSAYRNIKKPIAKYFNQKIRNSFTVEEETKFDLSALDILNENENHIVSNLFELLRDLYRAVAESIPSLEVNTYSQFEETFAPCCIKKSSIPVTLNVQNQVKQACRKLTIFTHEMQCILNSNKMFNNELYSECEYYLNHLRQYLCQLEMYKRVVMEHKHGKFLRDEVKVQAERLAILLEHTNRQIREVNFRVLAADWYIGLKYRADISAAAIQLNNDRYEKSNIGVVNEILQLCDMKEKAKSTITTTAATMPMPVVAALAETTKTPRTTKFISNQEVVNNAEPLLHANNKIFSVYKPDQIKRGMTTAGGHHVRHPVFYIG